MRGLWLVVALSFAVSISWTLGEMPQQFRYEGYYEQDGQPCTNTVPIMVRLYTNEYSGSFVCIDSNVVAMDQGYYSILVGDDIVFGSLSEALSAGETWIEVAIGDPTNVVAYELIQPVAYSLQANGVRQQAITSDMLAPGAILAEHISSSSISGNKLMNETITSQQIADGSIQFSDLDADDVNEQYINVSGDSMSGVLLAPTVSVAAVVSLTYTNPTAQYGGPIAIVGGYSYYSGRGGDITIQAGNGNSSYGAVGGGLALQAGNPHGSVDMTTYGTGSIRMASAKDIRMTSGGDLLLTVNQGNGEGGDVVLTAGKSYAHNGGDVFITAGAGGQGTCGSCTHAGMVVIRPGYTYPSCNATQGMVVLQDALGLDALVIRTNNILAFKSVDVLGHSIINASFHGDGQGLTNLVMGASASNAFVSVGGGLMSGSLTNQGSLFVGSMGNDGKLYFWRDGTEDYDIFENYDGILAWNGHWLFDSFGDLTEGALTNAGDSRYVQRTGGQTTRMSGSLDMGMQGSGLGLSPALRFFSYPNKSNTIQAVNGVLKMNGKSFFFDGDTLLQNLKLYSQQNDATPPPAIAWTKIHPSPWYQWQTYMWAASNGTIMVTNTTRGGPHYLIDSLTYLTADPTTNSVKRTGAIMTGALQIDAPAQQTNLIVAGWAQICYIPPQGGLSMGTFTNGLPQ